MAVSTDYQWGLPSRGDFTAGPGTNYRTYPDGFRGFEDHHKKRRTLDLTGDGLTGAALPKDSTECVVRFRMIHRTSPSTLRTWFGTFRTAWLPDTETEFRWRKGGVTSYLMGLTMDFELDDSEEINGLLIVTATFLPTDPTIHTA